MWHLLSSSTPRALCAGECSSAVVTRSLVTSVSWLIADAAAPADINRNLTSVYAAGTSDILVSSMRTKRRPDGRNPEIRTRAATVHG